VNYRQKAKDLVKLAVDERTPEKERLSAMVAVVKLIHQHDLLSSPLDGLLNTDNETVQAAATLFGQVTSPDFIDSVKRVARGFTGRRATSGSGRTTSGGRRR
jgi:hypothetical protein